MATKQPKLPPHDVADLSLAPAGEARIAWAAAQMTVLARIADRFAAEQQHFAESMPSSVDRGAIKRLLDLSDLERYAPGVVMTAEGQPVRQLIYLADGIVKIERGDRVVAICGPGDYIGELSFLSGGPATATATSTSGTEFTATSLEPVRVG